MDAVPYFALEYQHALAPHPLNRDLDRLAFVNTNPAQSVHQFVVGTSIPRPVRRLGSGTRVWDRTFLPNKARWLIR